MAWLIRVDKLAMAVLTRLLNSEVSSLGERRDPVFAFGGAAVVVSFAWERAAAMI